MASLRSCPVRLKRHVPFVSQCTMAVFVGRFEDLNSIHACTFSSVTFLESA